MVKKPTYFVYSILCSFTFPQFTSLFYSLLLLWFSILFPFSVKIQSLLKLAFLSLVFIPIKYESFFYLLLHHWTVLVCYSVIKTAWELAFPDKPVLVSSFCVLMSSAWHLKLNTGDGSWTTSMSMTLTHFVMFRGDRTVQKLFFQ